MDPDVVNDEVFFLLGLNGQMKAQKIKEILDIKEDSED
jgi:hypothetical protein